MGASAPLSLPLALTMGEPAGIGGELALMAWSQRQDRGLPPFFLLDDPERLERLATDMNWQTPVEHISEPSEALDAFTRALPVISLSQPVAATLGRPDPQTAAAVLESIERAVIAVRQGQAAALVTNPIHKAALYEAGFSHAGHTDYLGALTGGRPTMMLLCPELRVVPVTVHLALRQAVEQLSTEAIIEAGKCTAEALVVDFGIARPRLAVAALNPHAGESSTLGDEEVRIIAPAVAALAQAGIDAVGPTPADTLFRAPQRQDYDAVLCMYHDQALIPLKTLAQDHGINITLGLPIVRTSPDHGTALDLVGTGQASEASLCAALGLAAEVASRRAGAQGIK